MAITEVGGGTQRAQIRGGNVTATDGIYPGNVTEGSLLVAGGAFWNAASDVTIGVTDTLGTSYTVFLGAALSWAEPGGSAKTYIAYGLAPSSGANTVTVTASAAASYINGVVDEFAGVHATPLDVDASESTGTSTAPGDGLTTLTAGALVVGVMTHAGAGVITSASGSGYTLLDEDETADRCYYAAEFAIAGAAGAQTVDWALGSGQAWTAHTAAFQAAAVGATANRLLLQDGTSLLLLQHGVDHLLLHEYADGGTMTVGGDFGAGTRSQSGLHAMLEG